MSDYEFESLPLQVAKIVKIVGTDMVGDVVATGHPAAECGPRCTCLHCQQKASNRLYLMEAQASDLRKQLVERSNECRELGHELRAFAIAALGMEVELSNGHCFRRTK